MRQIIPLLTLLFLFGCSSSKLEVLSTSCEYKAEPRGINPSSFNLGWKLKAEERGTMQIAYQVVLASEEKNLDSGSPIWNSGKVASEQSILVKYTGDKLEPGHTYFWKVKVWDNHGNKSVWSKPAKFTTALISEADWGGAQWIALDSLTTNKRIVPGIHLPGKEWRNKDVNNHKLPMLRKEFNVKEGLKQALVFVSGLGHYELTLNGQKVGNSFLAPGWTNYDDYVFYNTFNITRELSKGENAFGAMLGNGFFIVPNVRYRKAMTAYGNPMMILKLQLEYNDGSVETVITDQSWKAEPGPVTLSHIYSGETYNANLEQAGWDKTGFNDQDWANAIPVKPTAKVLQPEMDYPVTIGRTLDVKSIQAIDASNSNYLYDFGQNASGVISIQVRGNKGDSIFFYPAELKNEDLTANQNATGSPYIFTYVLKGDGVESWTPQFTYYGFRYVEVKGACPDTVKANPALPQIVSMKLEHIYNSVPRTGQFNTSFELFNRIDTLIDWAIRSNYVSLLTDCPHREKLGWIEQLYLMGGSVHYNYDLYHTYVKQIDDMISAQTPEGLVPDICPEYCTMWEWFRDSPEWGSASIQVPYLIYKWYGDKEILERSWNMMGRYAEYLRDTSVNHIIDHGLGDWYDLGPERPGIAQNTPRSLTGTAIYFSNVKLMAEMAAILGKTDEQKKYSIWAEEIKEAFNQKFLDSITGIYSTGSQTAISMPLVTGIVDDKDKPAIFQTLENSIEKDKKALTAGDIGFHYLVKALQENGGNQLLFEMNARDDVPGYGYQLKHGATALTESWQALPIVSNNHLMLGHIMEWFYGGLGGIDQTENSVAYKEVKISPQMVGDVQQTETRFESPYGTIVSDWEQRGGSTLLNVSIAVNAKAIVELPMAQGQQITEGGKLLGSISEIELIKQDKGLVQIKIGSGNYHFEVK